MCDGGFPWRELQDVFAEIGFDDFNPARLQRLAHGAFAGHEDWI